MDFAGASSQVGEHLEIVGQHRIGIEVVLGAPDGIEAQRLGELGDAHLVAHHLGIRHPLMSVLEEQHVPGSHNVTSLFIYRVVREKSAPGDQCGKPAPTPPPSDGLTNFSTKRSCSPRCFMMNQVRSSLGLRSTADCAASLNPAAFISLTSKASSMRCRVLTSRAPEPGAALLSITPYTPPGLSALKTAALIFARSYPRPTRS